MTDESAQSNGDERATLGNLLSANAELVVGVLRPEPGTPPVPVLAAITATRNLGHLVDDILHTLARQARQEGHTWAELGDLLGTSRQAAYQRFSGPMPPSGPFPPPPPFPPIPPGPPHPHGAPDTHSAPDTRHRHHPPGPPNFPPPGAQHAAHHPTTPGECANPSATPMIPPTPPGIPQPQIPPTPGTPPAQHFPTSTPPTPPPALPKP
ncbi:hypothetical protein [Nocardia bovistercoris]|uniref:Uncharacterized protein n=1 Tax=Nocardia bovistercoris TaxID=2785916 RepID=A0A931N7N7_9NOCA|nr:hypothetical protein [Nocardia bovistercoris]MBH0781821.1 hypothetical protein [Nocardia bovistercoris]